MPRQRARLFPLLPLLPALLVGCATESSLDRSSSSSSTSTSRQLRTNAGKEGFAGWDRLVKVLSQPDGGGAGCRALKQDRDDQGHALVLSAACLFSDGMTTVSPPSRAAVDAIAAELRGATDREFWIAATVPVGSAEASAQTTRERASAFVNALIAAGVPPNRLAALLGPGSDAELTSSRLAETPLAGAATIEIVAAPVSMSGP